MKVLLTIEEYRERIIGLVMAVASRTISECADDYFKWKVIEMLTELCITNQVTCIKQDNQMFIRVFGLDRKGNPLEESLKRINKAEADEFNSQKWYKEFNEDAMKRWKSVYEIYPYGKMPGKDDWDHLYYITRVLQHAFIDNCNTKYNIEKEIFSRMYGHEFEYDKSFNPLRQ